MANEVIGLDVQLKLEGVRRALADLKDGTSDAAKDIFREFQKNVKTLEKSVKDAARASNDASKDVKRLGDVFGTTGSNATKLAGILGVFSPQAAEAARTVNDLGDAGEAVSVGVEALGLSLGAAGVAVAGVTAAAIAGYGVWNFYAASADAAKAATDRLHTTLTAIEPAAKRLADAQLQADIATGKLTAAEGQYRQGKEAAAKARDADIAKTLESLGVTQTQLEVMQSMLQGTNANAQAVATYDQNVVQAVAAVGAINSAFDQQVVALGEVRDATLAADKAAKDKEASAKAQALSAREAAEAERALLEALQAENRAGEAAAATYASSMTAMQGQETAARRLLMSKEQLIEADYAAAKAATDAETRKALAAATTATAAETIEEQRRATSLAQEEVYQQKLQELRDETAAKAAEDAQRIADAEAQAMQGTINTVGGYVQQSLGMLDGALSDSYTLSANMATRLQDQLTRNEQFYTTAQKAELEKRADAARKQAIDAFEADKAVKLAEVFASTQLAAINAIAQSPPPSPLGIAGAIIAEAAGAASMAAIASTTPQFHSGGEFFAPDEGSATLRNREYVMNPTGAALLGKETMDRANNGMRPDGGQAVFVVNQYEHTRMVRRFERDSLLRNNPVAQAIQQGRLLGQET